VVLVDNTVLSNFAKVEKLHLLKEIFDKVCITSQVLEEFKFGIKRGVLPDTELKFQVLALKEEEMELYESLRTRLGKGEASSIAVAKFRKMTLLTDDHDARKVANIMEIPVSGTIGVLTLCVKRGLLSKEQGNKILKNMILKGFYSPVESLDEVM